MISNDKYKQQDIKRVVGQQVFQAVGFLMRKAEAAVQKGKKRIWGHSCRHLNGQR